MIRESVQESSLFVKLFQSRMILNKPGNFVNHQDILMCCERLWRKLMKVTAFKIKKVKKWCMHKNNIKTRVTALWRWSCGIGAAPLGIYAVAPQSLTGVEMSSSGRPVIIKGHVCKNKSSTSSLQIKSTHKTVGAFEFSLKKRKHITVNDRTKTHHS